MEYLHIDDVTKIPHSHSLNREHYSPSFINGWLSCPAKQVFLSLTDKDTSSSAMKIGADVHRILEGRYSDKTDLKPDELLTDEEQNEVAEYIKAYDSIPDYNPSAKNVKHYTEIKLESKVKPLGYELDIPLKGFVDRLDISNSGVFVIDYKTSTRDFSSCKYLDQMTIYKWLVEEVYSTEVKDCYVASLYRDKPRYIREKITDVSQSKLIDKIINVDSQVLKASDTGEYEKRRGFACRYCPFKDICENTDEIDDVDNFKIG